MPRLWADHIKADTVDLLRNNPDSHSHHAPGRPHACRSAGPLFATKTRRWHRFLLFFPCLLLTRRRWEVRGVVRLTPSPLRFKASVLTESHNRLPRTNNKRSKSLSRTAILRQGVRTPAPNRLFKSNEVVNDHYHYPAKRYLFLLIYSNLFIRCNNCVWTAHNSIN